MIRDSFIFYRSFYEAIKDLPRDIQGEIYTAIMEYSLYGKETEHLKPVARSIFTLIKPQIDTNIVRYENGKKGGRKGDKNQSETKAKPMANQSETNGEPNYNVNYNVNDNSLSLSLSPLESRESCESEEDTGGVSAADRERIFEILFFRNFKNAEKETDRLIDHYSAVGWRRHGDIRAVRDKTALAKGWMPENKEQGIGKFQPDVLAKLQAIYAEIKAESPQDASTIIHGTRGTDETHEDFRIICDFKQVVESYERHSAIVMANNLTNGKRLKYGVPKK